MVFGKQNSPYKTVTRVWLTNFHRFLSAETLLGVEANVLLCALYPHALCYLLSLLSASLPPEIAFMVLSLVGFLLQVVCGLAA